jgi:hypothetical protein
MKHVLHAIHAAVFVYVRNDGFAKLILKGNQTADGAMKFVNRNSRKGVSSALLQLSSGFHLPDLFDRVSTEAIDFLLEVNGYTDVIRNNANLISNLKTAFRSPYVDVSMLLIHSKKARFWRFKDISVALLPRTCKRIQSNRLRADIQDDLSVFGDGDHRG